MGLSNFEDETIVDFVCGIKLGIIESKQNKILFSFLRRNSMEGFVGVGCYSQVEEGWEGIMNYRGD